MSKERAERTGSKEQQPKIKIGIIDDSDIYVDQITRSFAMDDIFLTRIAASLDEALTAIPKIDEQDFSAVFVDKNLGDGDGSDAIKAIKQLFPDLLTIGITASENAEVDGADLQFFKGSGIQALLDLVENTILKERKK